MIEKNNKFDSLQGNHNTPPRQPSTTSNPTTGPKVASKALASAIQLWPDPHDTGIPKVEDEKLKETFEAMMNCKIKPIPGDFEVFYSGGKE